jgi:hypothetical protein
MKKLIAAIALAAVASSASAFFSLEINHVRDKTPQRLKFKKESWNGT